jgi:hypothetical protein
VGLLDVRQIMIIEIIVAGLLQYLGVYLAPQQRNRSVGFSGYILRSTEKGPIPNRRIKNA